MRAATAHPAGQRRPAAAVVRWGLGLAIAALVVPFVWIPALVLGIVALNRGRGGIAVAIVIASIVASVANAALLQAVAVKPYRVPSEGMSPTVKAGDRILVNRLAGAGVGDVVAYRAPAGSETGECAAPPPPGAMCERPRAGSSGVTHVQRIVAGPGDTVALRAGRLVRNGRPVEEPYAQPCREPELCDFPHAITVPDGHWYVLGDNRGASFDSRFWGPLPADAVIGTHWLTYRHGS